MKQDEMRWLDELMNSRQPDELSFWTAIDNAREYIHIFPGYRSENRLRAKTLYLLNKLGIVIFPNSGLRILIRYEKDLPHLQRLLPDFADRLSPEALQFSPFSPREQELVQCQKLIENLSILSLPSASWPAGLPEVASQFGNLNPTIMLRIYPVGGVW